MKQLFKKLAIPALCLFILGAVTSCQNDDNETTNEPDELGIEESRIISFDEIEKMTRDIIDGELQISEEDEVSSKSSGRSRESRTYDFNAEVTSGAGEGTILTGELKLNLTLYHASFAIVRGKLTLEDGTEARVRGAVISDGKAYLIFRLPGRTTIFGIGNTASNGDLAGRFTLFGSGIGIGDWAATLTGATAPNKTIVDIIVEDGRFTSLVGALQAAELVDALSGEGPFTVFAPTDNAFAALDAIPSGDALKQVLLYHVISGKLDTRELLAKEMVATLQGENIKITLNADNEIVINDTVKLLSANISGTNGIIQIIDAVLIPPSFNPLPTIVELAIATPELSTLVSAVQSAGLVDALNGEGPFTIFAPTNDAFAVLDALPEGDVLKEVLLYHVVSGKFTAQDLLSEMTVTTLQGKEVTISMQGDKVLLNGSIEVAIADIEASNGIVHVITGVLLPPANLQTIVEIAVGTPELSTLVSAVQSAGLVDVLNGEGPFTVFAPTNDAFAALDALPEGDALKEVLLYHVVSGKLSVQDLLKEVVVKTIQGDRVIVRMVHGKVILNRDIEVTIADIEASNGIIHVIEGVLLPH